MAPKARVQKRLYYKIGEACKALGIQPYVLRYWETEFPALSPSKSRSGQRVYSEKELEIIRRIKQLLYDEGYTIAGAKKKLEGELAAGILGESAGASSTPSAASAATTAIEAAGPAAGGAPAAPFLFHGPAAAAPASPGPAAQPAPGSAPAGAGSGAGSGAGPVRTVPFPLVPVAPATVTPGAAATAASPTGPAGRESWATLPLEPPPPLPADLRAGSHKQASTSAGEAGASPRNATSARMPVATVAGPPADHAAGPAPGADQPPAAASQALDTDAAKQIETLRKGIHKALQEAREILALLDSRSPQ
jgi:DNA-binding transcriptional MerR regulator